MPGKSMSAATLPYKSRLSLKLGALFVGTFLAVFLSGLAYDVFATMLENQQTEADSLAQPALTPIEPKIEADLAKVLASDAAPDAVEIKDPFSDRSNISGNVKTPVGAASGGRTATTQPSSSSVAQGGSVSRPGNSSANPAARTAPNNPAMSANGTPVNYAASPEATNARIRARQEKMRAGQDGGPESTVLAIDDLLPVGMVSGGNGETEVMLYSQALQQTFSFPIGTPFYDGWLVEMRPDGVGFGVNNQNGAVFLKGWANSIKQPTSNNSAEKDSPGRTAGMGYED
jgi:hypothetical protein